MKLKKSPEADLESKKGLFLEIGLIISILLIIGVFSYSQSEKIIEMPEPEGAVAEPMTVEITRQEEKLKLKVSITPVQVLSTLMKIVEDDTEITTEILFTDFDDETIFAPDVGNYSTEGGVDQLVNDTPYIKVENMPSFMGGDINKFREWVQKRIKYPTIAAEMGIQGRVSLSFVIETDGRLTNIVTLQTPDRSLSTETIRILNTSPKWAPGKQGGKAVRVKYTLPIVFKLD